MYMQIRPIISPGVQDGYERAIANIRKADDANIRKAEEEDRRRRERALEIDIAAEIERAGFTQKAP
jgi:hypothetical protein